MIGAPVFGLDYEQTAGEPSDGVLMWLRYLMHRWDQSAPSERVDTPMAPSTQKALKALGYLEDDP